MTQNTEKKKAKGLCYCRFPVRYEQLQDSLRRGRTYVFKDGEWKMAWCSSCLPSWPICSCRVCLGSRVKMTCSEASKLRNGDQLPNPSEERMSENLRSS